MSNSYRICHACTIALCLIFVSLDASAQTPAARDAQHPISQQAPQSPEPARSPEVKAAECNCGVCALYAVVRLLGSKNAFSDVANAKERSNA